jgi:hypothetical protein
MNESLKQQLRSERQIKERYLRDKMRMKGEHEKQIRAQGTGYRTLQATHNAEVATLTKLRTELDRERSRNNTLTQLQVSKQQTINTLTTQNRTLQQSQTEQSSTITRLTNDLAVERNTVQNLRRQLEKVHNRQTARLLDLQRIVGVPVIVRRINSGGESSEDVNTLTPLMQNHLKTAVEKFRSYCQVTRIEYIMNDTLHEKYDDARSRLSFYARPITEQILFHGTNERNINS